MSARCSKCARLLPLDGTHFGKRQRDHHAKGAPVTCLACTTSQTPAQRTQARNVAVAAHMYNESGGQVDGKDRKVPRSNCSTPAQAPTEAMKKEAKVIKERVFAAYNLKTVSYRSEYANTCHWSLASCAAEEPRTPHLPS